jgi:competence protein ComEA
MDAAPPPTPLAGSAWPRGAQLAAALLLGAAVALLGTHAWGYLGWGSRPTELKPGQAHRIDLNRADRAELLQLRGIGPPLAERIVEYRKEHGGFRNVEELSQVKGIGPATLARLRPYVYVEDAEDGAETETVTAPAKPAGAARKGEAAGVPKKATALSEPIDINTATAAELSKVPDIGPVRSQAIVEERKKGPFKSVDDLCRVRGIKAKTVDRLRPYVTAGSESARVVAKE